MKISIVVPAYNSEKTLSKTLEACLNQKYPCTYEIIVVDDGSTDSTPDIIKKYPIKYIYQENSGPAKARNTGWKVSSGTIICFTDSDCIPHQNWIAELIKGFDTDNVGAIAGSYDIANRNSLLAQCIHEEIKLRHARFKKYIRSFGSYNVAIKRAVLEQTGGFDESYRTSSGEDNDLSYKILKAGYKIAFRSDALVSHYHTEVLWKYLKEQYRHGYWRMKLYKNFPEMKRGDDYTTFKDIVEPPLSLIVFSSLFLLWHNYGFFIFLLSMLFLIILQIPNTMAIIIKKKDPKLIYSALINFLRSFARGFGMIRGILKFWV